MTLIAEISDQLKIAMKAHDTARRDALRLILDALKTREKENLAPLTPDLELAILTGEAKKRREAIDSYHTAGAPERARGEEYELSVIQSFLPQPLTVDEVRAIIDDLCQELAITSKKDRGKLMKALMNIIKGRFPGGEAKKLVDDLSFDN